MVFPFIHRGLGAVVDYLNNCLINLLIYTYFFKNPLQNISDISTVKKC